jgi:hypothetical protein
MITVYYNNDSNLGKILRPAPYVSITFNANRNKSGYLGGEYSITLNGTILASGGSPIYDKDSLIERSLAIGANFDDGKCPTEGEPPTYDYSYTKPTGAYPNGGDGRTNDIAEIDYNRAMSILEKQKAIRALFARDGQYMEISPITNDAPILSCYPSVESVNFEEGTYVNTCKYTINLSAPIMYKDGKASLESHSLSTSNAESYKTNAENLYNYDQRYSINNQVQWSLPSGLIEDFTDTWSLEADEGFFLKTAPSPNGNRSVPRMYRITRNVSATGKTAYYRENSITKRYEAWENARKFLLDNILRETGYYSTNRSTDFPGLFSYSPNSFGYGFLQLSGIYKGYNHVRTENIDVTAGSYSISDTWLLTSGNNNTIESYDLSLSSSVDSPLINVSMNGKIKGLTTDMMDVANTPFTSSLTPRSKTFEHAIKEYYRLSNHDKFGFTSALYQRACAMSPVQMHPVPTTNNITVNKHLGEIDYNVSFNNRPHTFFSNVKSENINITDTYPGDIYAMMPVINRSTGPLFQYIGGISQYERSLSIEFVVDRDYMYNDSAKMTNKIHYLMRSPSKNPSSLIHQELQKLILTYSPAYEPFIRKYVVNPISESWDPKSGRYSVNISWVYELNQ